MDISAQLIPRLSAESLPIPSQAWLNGITTTRTPPPPVSSLVATARIRLLAADLTAPGLLDSAYIAGHSFPADLSSPEVQKTRLGREAVVQILDIEDISRSRWEQVEELEAIERGEQTRGREVIRLPVGGDENSEGVERGDEAATQALGLTSARAPGGVSGERDGADVSRKNATHKLILQDCKGSKMYALELTRVDKIGVGRTNIGEKILLRTSTAVSRGTILLEPATCVVLGGKVEAWQKSWIDGRLARLRGAAGADGRT